MPLEISMELRTWLSRHGLRGYLKVVDAPPNPDAQEVGHRVHPDTITNDQIRSVLGLKCNGKHDIEAPPQNVLKYEYGILGNVHVILLKVQPY